MSNRLLNESSPYLRQHASNPVDWYPFGAEAFAAAREADRPILLSIGYSACHWCHVMAHESFEDPATAEEMNRRFINIKVDREEHPDVDQIYQHSLQLFGEGGGWPLTMFLTPAGEPFFGGTYFPPQDRYGRPSFRRVLAAVARSYAQRREQVVKQGQEVLRALVELEARAASLEGGALAPDFAERAAARLLSRMDRREGGFEGAPKFPNATALSLQLRAYARSGDAAEVLPALLTLRKMAEGGIYDHLGGGFARYSTDATWLVPHFEKMLYDNGLLLKLYAEGYQIARQQEDHALADTCARVIDQTLSWLEREMRDASGGFYAAQDADSEGVEGKYFVFTPEQVVAACGEELGRLLCRCYDIRPGGNWRDPHGHAPAGSSILHLIEPPRDAEEAASLAEARARLLAARLTRVPPGTDDKILTGWNGLMISGLAVAGAVLGDGRLVLAARRTADFALARLRGEGGALWRTFKHGAARLPATLDDHAFLAEGLWHLASASGELSYLTEAGRLMDEALAQLYEPETGTFYLAPQGEVPLVTRPTSFFDSATPSGVSVSCMNLLRLGELCGRADLRRIAERTLRAHAESALRNPFGLSNLCAAVDLLQHGLTLIVLRWPTGADPAALRRASVAAYQPDPFVLAAPGEATDLPAAVAPVLEGKAPREGHATAYLCHHQRCEAPIDDEATLRARLSRHPLA